MATPSAFSEVRGVQSREPSDMENGTGEKQELTRVKTAQDWTGPDDPENPINWPLWKRIYHTALPAVMGFAATIGSSIYVPGIADLSETMHISHELALVGLTLWVVGLGFGPVLAAPLSEKYGRTIVYHSSIFVSALFTIGSGYSQTTSALMVTRFFGGAFAAPVLAVGAGTVADLWPPVHRAIGTAFFVIAPFWGPALGPLVGGYVAQNKGWQWTSFVTTMIMGFSLLLSLPMSETHKATILSRRAKRLGLPPPPKGPTGAAAVRMVLIVTFLRPLYMLVTEPIVAFFSLYIAFNFSVLFAFFDAFPIVFSEVYGFGIEQTGLTWISVLVGCLIGLITFVTVDKMVYRRKHAVVTANGGKGEVQPEHRLYAAMIGSVGLPIGLFWLAWTARADVHWISPVLAAMPFAWGNYNVFTACMMYLIDTYGPRTGASAAAANGLLRYVLGAIFPLFTTQMYSRLGIGWATSLYGFLSLLLLPIPWILFRWGPAIRARSKYTP